MINHNEIDCWELVESPFRVEHAKAWEGMFTLGSGYLHVRGSLEEHLSDAPQDRTYTRMPANVTCETFADTKSKWGTYVPGVFSRHPLLGNQMVNLPWFLGMVPVVDGERLDVEACRIADYRRVLNLRDATLTRTLQWTTKTGIRVNVTFERFVSAARLGLCVQRLRIRCDQPARLRLEAGLDADVRTNGFDHFVNVQFSYDRYLSCEVRTDAGDRIVMATAIGCDVPGSSELCSNLRQEDRRASIVTECLLPAGVEAVFTKRTIVATSRDRDDRDPSRELAEISDQPWQELLAEHTAIWHERWAGCDVIVEGDAAAQQAVRASLFHLLRAHVPGDDRVAIDAKGYAGEAYWGRYFWDTEMFLLPFFLYTDPDRARTLVDFRVQSLPGAQANAKRYGYRGARYAWESDSAGVECCPNWQYGDHEVHVTADVVYGLVHYAQATGDDAYLKGPAARVLVETARYWMERMDTRPGDGHPSILGVMGPDEYTPISNNNSFTNAMVAEALRAAARFGRYGGATETECQAFLAAADALPIPRSADGTLVLQCEEFERLAEPCFERIWPDRSRTLGAQVSQERLYRIKALKQADVLMLMMLFPHRFTQEEIRRAWDYYLPYTTHDSSLSAGVHAIVAARLGLHHEAWAFWEKAKGIDLDVEHGGAAEGIHIANAAAVWQILVFGFAGMLTAMQSDTLTLSPRLPQAWTRLAFPLVWKGCRLELELTRTTCRLTNRGSVPLGACVSGKTATIRPAQTEEWGLTQ
ncbi:MAG TPA: glycosyl hydrolase family 65 protein [Phycisphaerae bacterium]|nr:glycosyl hydrolase family 65 protein [Phycisphaerae bacterium]HOQ85486.1 glycosyl hydrolase family 65 protein [Phycisphaerae bacterium]HPU24639.1 glycosyl hydrolase family 65 protein [Phycisphaerae bacterium]